MLTVLKRITLVSIVLPILGSAAVAKDPLIASSSVPTVVADRDLANVKGSGLASQYWGYYGTLGSYYAYLYGIAGYNESGAGLYTAAYNDFLSARNQASNAATYFNAAAYYAFFGQ
jgi:hypothetical protein